MRKNARKPVDCPVCQEPFMRPRPEQVYCSTACGHQARSKRAMVEKEQNGKKCYGCREIKPLTEFHKNAAMNDGHKQVCKVCEKVEWKKRIERVKADPDRLARYRLQQRRAGRVAYAKALSMETTGTIEEWLHRLNDERRWIGSRSWRCYTGLTVEQVEEARQMRREEQREKEWLEYWGNPDIRRRQLEEARAAHQARPWVMLARKHRRDALLIGAADDGSVTVNVLEELWEKTERCLYCGRELTQWNKSVEHMVPLSKGGAHTLGNVIIVCRLCNETKRAMYFDEWLERISEPYRSMAHARFINQG